MSLRTAARVFVVILAVSGFANAQREKPLFLDARPGEDPSVIDVTEITGQFSKHAVQEYEKGLNQARKGNRKSAVERLQAAISIEPDFFNAHNSLAILLHHMSRYREAEQQYQEARRLNPRSVAPLVNLASLHIDEALDQADPTAARAMLNEALASLNEAQEVQPGAPMAYYFTGVVYYLTSFFEESESNFKKALDSGDDRLTVGHLALADIYIRLREWDNVVAELDAFLAARPFNPNRQTIRSVRNFAAAEIAVVKK